MLPKMKKLFCFCVLLSLLSVQPGRGDLFSALVDLERVLYAENDIARDLKEYIAREEERLVKLKKVAADYEQHSMSALHDTGKHLGNPVNAFLLVKRFTSDWEKVQGLIMNNASADFLGKVEPKTRNFPDYEDLTGAATALLRLQDTYKLSSTHIAKGDIMGTRNSPKLSAAECFDLGRLAYQMQDYYHTVMWMQEALDRWDEEEPKTIQKASVLDYLAYSTSMQGNIYQALKLTNELLVHDPNHIRAQNNKRYYEKLIADEEAKGMRKGDEGQDFRNERPLDDYRASDEFVMYEKLCRGEDTHEYKEAHKLYCRYKKHELFWWLRPLKEEVVYFKPYIAMFHDFLTDTEMAKIKELATPKLNRATVQNPQTGKLETAHYRVSKSAWLKDHDDPVIERLSRKITLLTGLTMETAEELQVANYGIGGHYEPHFDFARKREVNTFEDWRGNRIATALFYMSDVEAGGATVFPYIGVKVFPEKGAAAFWYNLLKSGEGDYDTRHAACPVLVGTKWVSNKWIHERGQEFNFPCSKNSNE